jgi:hypothetical protein
MANRIVPYGVSIALCLLLILPLFAQNSLVSESVTWLRVSNYLDCFLVDPVKNFALIEGVNELEYWTLIYNQIRNKNYLYELFSTRFSVSDIDEAKLGVIFHLLKAYTSLAAYHFPKPIISRIIEISAARPDWFGRKLLLRKDWREITRLIMAADTGSFEGQKRGLRETLSDVHNQDIKNELTSFFNELENEKKSEIIRFEEFMKDPAANLDRISDIYNLCATMNEYEVDHLDENKVLLPKYNSLLVLGEWIKCEINEKKIKVLFHLLNHCSSAYHEDMLMDIAITIFFEHEPIFVLALKDEPTRRSIIAGLSDFLPDRKEHFSKTLGILGSSEIELKIRSQLEFLAKISEYDH